MLRLFSDMLLLSILFHFSENEELIHTKQLAAKDVKKIE
jgi:hypothetical protein